MSLTEPIADASGSVLAMSGLVRSTTKHRLASLFSAPAWWVLLVVLLSLAFLLGGVEVGTILLAVLIGARAISQPRSALWSSTAFLIFLFVFFQKAPLVRPELPWEFYYWGAGLAIITLGLGVAWLRVHCRRSNSVRTKLQMRFGRAMFLIFLVSLIASMYGAYIGNSLFAVARQLFGCLLLPVYYRLGRAFFRTADDVGHWLRCVTWAAVAGASWYVAKLGFITLTGDAYYREQSPMGFFAGVIGAVLFVELLQEQRFRNRIRYAAAFAVCVLAIVLMGARFVAGSLAATAIVFAAMRWRKKRLAVLVPGLALLGVAIPFGVHAFERLIEDPEVIGEIAFRFSPFQLDSDGSYIGRAAQWQAVVDITRQHPILGGGMGAEVSFVASDLPKISGGGVYIDNGWGFILLKMGFVGLSAFLFLIGSFLRFVMKKDSGLVQASSQNVRGCLAAVLLFGLFSFIGGPTFFHFTESGFLGTAFGGLAVLVTGTHPDGSRSSKDRSVSKAAFS